jgi:type III restriction enzyme
VVIAPLPLEGGGVLPIPPMRFTLTADFTAEALPAALREAVTVIRGTAEGDTVLQLTTALPREAEAAFIALLPPAQHEEARRKIVLHRAEIERRQSPAEQGQRLELPVLHVWLQDELLLAEPEVFLTDEVWDLADTRRFPPRLTPTEFNYTRDEQRMALDVAHRRGREVLDISALQGSTVQGDFIGHSDLTATSLANWLAVECRNQYVYPPALHQFCLNVVSDQLAQRHTVMELGLLRYRLARAISSKVTAYLQGAQALGYSCGLFADSARVEVRFDEAFHYPRSYPLIQPYTGSFRFQHHFYGPDNISKLKAAGEEFDCARALDGLAGLDYWVRNIDSLPEQSFRLPLATGWFYPDFVAKLKDGRLLVVEYKGALLNEPEKRMVGELWAGKSAGRGLFVWVVKKDAEGRSVAEQLKRTIR